jgi:hypothetical protein
VIELGFRPLIAMLVGGFTVRVKVAVTLETPLPPAVMVMVWPLTKAAVLEACRLMLPELPVPG